MGCSEKTFSDKMIIVQRGERGLESELSGCLEKEHSRQWE